MALAQQNCFFLDRRGRAECSCGQAFSDSTRNSVSLPAPKPGVSRSPSCSLATSCLTGKFTSASYLNVLLGLSFPFIWVEGHSHDLIFLSFISIATPFPAMLTFQSTRDSGFSKSLVGWAGETIQSLKHLSCKHEDLSLIL